MILISSIIALEIDDESNDNSYDSTIIKNSIKATYIEDDRIEVKLFNSKYTSLVSSLIIDGVLMLTISDTILFNLSGIHKVVIIFNKNLNSTAQMFEFCSKLTEVDLSKLETKNIENTEEMFLIARV